MERVHAHPLPARDPIAGGPLVITEMEAVESGVTIRGRFEVPRFARLSPEQAHYLETFLRCRGMLNSVEKELGISYPTARARLDAVLKALDLHAVREDSPPPSVETAETKPDTEPVETTSEPEPSFDETFGWDEPMEGEGAASDEVETPEAEAEPPISRSDILSLLERGEITVEEAKKKLGAAR